MTSMLVSAQRRGRQAERRELVVELTFEGANGARWRAVGGGDTLADAIAFARESTPSRFDRLVAIADLYGD